MKREKRAMDLCGAALGILLLAPFFVIIAAALLCTGRGGIFFRQERIGLGGRPFRMWKFRTMVADAERRGPQLTVGHDPRITRVGYWLRKYKLDELPQLFNVLAGDMSLVGPRPEVRRYVELYATEQRRVLDLVPGITDPASIAFRNESELLARASNPEEFYVEEIMPLKVRINLEYAARATLWLDLGVILQSSLCVFMNSDALAPSGARLASTWTAGRDESSIVSMATWRR